MLRSLFFITLMVAGLFTPGVVYDAAGSEDRAVGRITDVQGAVTVERRGKVTPVRSGMDLYAGDSIVTGSEGRVGFTLGTVDQFRMTEDSQVDVDELSAVQEDDTLPLLRLSLGYLWAKIRQVEAAMERPVVQTPTAVMGIRGTEFETVVTEDSSSVVAVDEGAVQVSAEKQMTVSAGQQTEVDPDEKIQTPQPAPPPEKRDWQSFRRMRRERFMTELPRRVPEIRGRFERHAAGLRQLAERTEENARQLSLLIRQFQETGPGRDRKSAFQQLQRIRESSMQFRQTTWRFREAVNRIRLAGRYTALVERQIAANPQQYAPDTLNRIETDLKAVSALREQFNVSIEKTIAVVRNAYRDLRELRTQIGERPRRNR